MDFSAQVSNFILQPAGKTFSLMWTEYQKSFPTFYQAYLDN